MKYRIVNPLGHDRMGIPTYDSDLLVGYMCETIGPDECDLVSVMVTSGPLSGKKIQLHNDDRRLAMVNICPMEVNHV